MGKLIEKKVTDLLPGDVIGKPVYTEDGQMLIEADTVIMGRHIALLETNEVYLVIVEPLVKPVISRRDTVVLQPRVVYTGSEETGDEDYRPVSIRPFVGASIAEISAMDISGTIEPIIGISLRVPISLQASIAPYYYDGWNFGNPGLRRRGIGLDYYPIERGYFRLGGSGIWLMNANTGYAQERALGGEVAIGVQPEPWLDFALSGHVYRLTTVDDRHGRAVGGVSFTVRLGPELHP